MSRLNPLRRAEQARQRHESPRRRGGCACDEQKRSAFGRAEAIARDLVADATFGIQPLQQRLVDEAVHTAHEHEIAIAALQPRARFAQGHQAGRAAARCGHAARGVDEARCLLRQARDESHRVERLLTWLLGQAQQQRYRCAGGLEALQWRDRFFERRMREAQHARFAFEELLRPQRFGQFRQALVGHATGDEGFELAVQPIDLGKARDACASRRRVLGQAQAHWCDDAGVGDDEVVGRAHGSHAFRWPRRRAERQPPGPPRRAARSGRCAR